jgi:hypothetical protein
LKSSIHHSPYSSTKNRYFIDLYSMQPPKLVRTLFAALALLSAACLAQTPTVLSAPDSPLVFELPVSPSLTRQLSAATSAKLATPAQHQQHGLLYPLWLSDAIFTVKTRAGQRQSVVVHTQRGNPELSTDLLLTLNNNGIRTFAPSTLMFDKLSTFAGLPIPPDARKALPEIAYEFSDLQKTTKALDFSAPQATADQASVATAYPVKSAGTENHVRGHVTPSQRSPSQQVNRSPSSNPQQLKPVAAPLVTAATTVTAAPQATSDKASQPPPLVAQTAPALPARPANIPPFQPKPMPEPSWLDDWPLLAGAFVGVLALLYLAFRLLKKRSKPDAFSQTNSAPGQAANTVFGVNTEEAQAMHKKWLSDQVLSKKQ